MNVYDQTVYMSYTDLYIKSCYLSQPVRKVILTNLISKQQSFFREELSTF